MENTQNTKQILEEIKQLKKAGDFDGMLAAAQKATQALPGDEKILDALHEAQALYINQKLKSDLVHQLEKKGDYVTLQGVYKKLLSVFPESKKLQKLLKDVKAKLEKAQTSESKNYFDGIKKQIRELASEGRTDEAIQACYEVLSQNPEMEDFQALLEKVQKQAEGQTEKAMDSFFEKAGPALKAEFSQDKDKFIRV